MNSQKDVTYFMKQRYYAILTRKQDTFYLYIPELSLIASDKDLKVAYEKLEDAKKAYFINAIEINAQDEIDLPSSIKIKLKKNLLSKFGLFIVKLSAIFIIGLILLNLSAAVARFISYEIKGIPYKIINKISAMPDEELQEKRLLVRKLLGKLKPFIDDFKEILDNDKEPTPGG
ncbi:MAG: hypothetical protein PHO42_00460 [Candidatus Omnitrophica bacterium]|nr:hypothetical protein [Candidatus Omnitrophota bacterium]